MLFLDVVLISLNVYRGVMYHFLYKMFTSLFVVNTARSLFQPGCIRLVNSYNKLLINTIVNVYFQISLYLVGQTIRD